MTALAQTFKEPMVDGFVATMEPRAGRVLDSLFAPTNGFANRNDFELSREQVVGFRSDAPKIATARRTTKAGMANN